jgi:hypothetical protein
MTVKYKLIQELATLPDALVAELLEHAPALRQNGRGGTALAAAEALLAGDWFRPEEDEAWKDL